MRLVHLALQGERHVDRHPSRSTDAVCLGLQQAILGLSLLALVLPGSASGATLTLEQAIDKALAANPSVRAARLEAIAAGERTSQSYARHLGDADLVGTASRFEAARLVRPLWGPIDSQTIAALPFDRDQFHYGAVWQIPIFAGGALFEGDRAARLLEAAAVKTAARAQDELRFNVSAAYRNVLGVRRAIDAAVSYEQALEHDESSARLRVATEAWASVDADKVSFALASARARTAALRSQLTSASVLLAALMGDDPTQFNPDLQDIFDEPVTQLPVVAELTVQAADLRPDLAAARDTAEAQSRRSAAVRGGFWPQIALAGSFLMNDGPSAGPPVATWDLTILVKIPLFADVGRAFAVREADAAAAAAAERERAKSLEVQSQVVDAVGRLAAARAAHEAGKAQRVLGAEVARVERMRFESGVGKVEDYLHARVQALDGETGFWQSLYTLQSSIDYLALVTGNGGSK